MINPWINFPNEDPYILADDRPLLATLAPRLSGTAKLRFEVVPSPFFGDPFKAKVILLALNPGFKEEDLLTHKAHPDLLNADMKNLTFSNVPSYYGLDERYSYSGLFKWSNPKLKDVIAMTGREKAANGICLIQFFPYHSTTYSPLNRILPSQKYSFHLVQSAIKQKKLFVIMRGRKIWEEQVPELREYPYIELKAPRNPYLTQTNMTREGFIRVVNAIREG